MKADAPWNMLPIEVTFDVSHAACSNQGGACKERAAVGYGAGMGAHTSGWLKLSVCANMLSIDVALLVFQDCSG